MKIVRGAEAGRRTLLARHALGEAELPEAVRRRTAEVLGADLPLEEAVRRIIRDVRDRGDEAVLRYNRAFDGVDYPSLSVPPEEVRAAYHDVDPHLIDALRFAADRIRRFHEAQLRHAARSFELDGVGARVRPLERAGVYVPGTKVVYPSSVLMTALPAVVAGVSDVIMVSPAGPDGRISPLKLVAADLAGVSRIFRASGAQAIAAMAYGTATIPRVDKICGPGNIFVTVAKREVYGVTGIDALYGPSETIVVADESADPRLCAADLLAQAEHDELATPLLITNSLSLAERVGEEVERQLRELEREPVARTSFDARGGAVVVDTVEEALALANGFAPEHMCLLLRDAERWADCVQNAGAVFVGETAPESLGDYDAGPSHVMPTSGTARFASPLGVHDFLKTISVVHTDAAALARLGPAAAAIGRAEGLTAHARAIEFRLEGPR